MILLWHFIWNDTTGMTLVFRSSDCRYNPGKSMKEHD
tara:strand:- start:20199 stop:20309 length:111 start_codon:yes stop_codon:yes gene_type:complete